MISIGIFFTRSLIKLFLNMNLSLLFHPIVILQLSRATSNLAIIANGLDWVKVKQTGLNRFGRKSKLIEPVHVKIPIGFGG